MPANICLAKAKLDCASGPQHVGRVRVAERRPCNWASRIIRSRRLGQQKQAWRQRCPQQVPCTSRRARVRVVGDFLTTSCYSTAGRNMRSRQGNRAWLMFSFRVVYYTPLLVARERHAAHGREQRVVDDLDGPDQADQHAGHEGVRGRDQPRCVHSGLAVEWSERRGRHGFEQARSGRWRPRTTWKSVNQVIAKVRETGKLQESCEVIDTSAPKRRACQGVWISRRGRAKEASSGTQHPPSLPGDVHTPFWIFCARRAAHLLCLVSGRLQPPHQAQPWRGVWHHDLSIGSDAPVVLLRAALLAAAHTSRRAGLHTVDAWAHGPRRTKAVDGHEPASLARRTRGQTPTNDLIAPGRPGGAGRGQPQHVQARGASTHTATERPSHRTPLPPNPTPIAQPRGCH